MKIKIKKLFKFINLLILKIVFVRLIKKIFNDVNKNMKKRANENFEIDYIIK